MAVNVVQSALSSRRVGRWLPWVSALVLAAGVIAFLVTYFGNTAKTEPTQPTGPPIHFAKPQKNIPFPKAAWRVARQFAFTAVPRRDLARSYAIAHPDERQGFTLKQWKSGAIPVPQFPVAKMQKMNWRNTNYAHPRDAQVSAVLIPTKASHQRPIVVEIGLTKIGRGAHARWTVSYFQPISGPPVPAP
jgi:hypothetical protein